MTKRYLNSLLTFKEHELTLAGVFAATGYNQKAIFIKKHSSSATTYTLRKKISAFITAITCFSHKPLIYVFNLGMIVSLIAFIFATYLFIRKIFFGINLSGWTSIILSIWLVGGIIIFCIGILGIYLSKIFVEVKDRPYTVVKKEYKKDF
jgi:putative glycosyltransferase